MHTILTVSHEIKDCRTNLHMCPIFKKGVHLVSLCEVIGYETKISPSHDKANNNQPIFPAAVPIAEVDISSQRLMMKAKVLFDTGVQKSFISKETVTALNLPKKGQAQLKIFGFLTNNNTQT